MIPHRNYARKIILAGTSRPSSYGTVAYKWYVVETPPSSLRNYSNGYPYVLRYIPEQFCTRTGAQYKYRVPRRPKRLLQCTQCCTGLTADYSRLTV